MPTIKHNLTIKEKRRNRVRAKIHGTALKPRLTVFRSNKYCYLQVVDDDLGKTIASISDAGENKKIAGTKTQRAIKIAEELAQDLLKKKVEGLVFDRSYYRYHGRVKAVAESLRKAGLKL